jgi:hypothetical protein
MINSSDLKERIREIMALSSTQVEERAYRALVQEELRQTEIQMLKILNKHGIRDSQMLEQFFREGTLPESEGWEDYFELDGLEFKLRKLHLLLKEI